MYSATTVWWNARAVTFHTWYGRVPEYAIACPYTPYTRLDWFVPNNSLWSDIARVVNGYCCRYVAFNIKYGTARLVKHTLSLTKHGLNYDQTAKNRFDPEVHFSFDHVSKKLKTHSKIIIDHAMSMLQFHIPLYCCYCQCHEQHDKRLAMCPSLERTSDFNLNHK